MKNIQEVDEQELCRQISEFFKTQVKLSCRLAVSRAQDEWRTSNLLQDIKYRLHVTVYFCGDL